MILRFPILSTPDFVLLRGPGPGLGNLLFPLYRAFQDSQRMGGKLIFPQFRQLKIGPLLRFEKDKRTYFELFAARSMQEVLLHLKALVGHGVPEDETHRIVHNPSGGDVVYYEGLKNYFHDLDPTYIRGFTEYLLRRARSQEALVRELREITRQDICAHLRRGDFRPVESGGSIGGGMSYRTEDDWYLSAVLRAKQRFPKGRITLFTDEAKLDKEFLERLGCQQIDSSQNALHALLKMAAHGAIVASRSSFSLWSAYLGRQFICFPVQFDLGKFMPSPLNGEAV